MKLLSVIVVLAFVGQLKAYKLTKEEYALNVESYLANNHEDKSDYDKLKVYLQTLGPAFNEVADEVYGYYKTLMNLYKTAVDDSFCLSGGPKVAKQMKEAMSFTTPEKTPILSKITDELLTKYALLCRKQHQTSLVAKADSFSKDLQPYVDQLFKIAETKVKRKVAYEATGPFFIDKLLSDYELASVAYSLIIGQQDDETSKITDPKSSVSDKIVTSVYTRYVRTPCKRYVQALGEPQDHFEGLAVTDTILGRDTSDEAVHYNTIASTYAICRHFAGDLIKGERDPMEDQLVHVITAETGKKVKGGKSGLISSCFRGSCS